MDAIIPSKEAFTNSDDIYHCLFPFVSLPSFVQFYRDEVIKIQLALHFLNPVFRLFDAFLFKEK